MDSPDARRIPLYEMTDLIYAGEAEPLLLGVDVGPTRYADRWWHVPAGGLAAGFYELASTEQSVLFDQSRARLHRADLLLTEELQEREADWVDVAESDGEP